MNDNEMKANEYKMRCIERIKEMFRIGLRTNSYSAGAWKYIINKAIEYNICDDLVEITKAELKAGLPDFS